MYHAEHLEKQLLGAIHAAGNELSLVRVARKLSTVEAEGEEDETEDAAMNAEADVPLLPDAGQTSG